MPINNTNNIPCLVHHSGGCFATAPPMAVSTEARGGGGESPGGRVPGRL